MDEEGGKGKDSRCCKSWLHGRLDRMFVLATIILILMCLVLIGVIIFISLKGPEKATVCSHIECVRAAARVADNVDFSIKPCDNFYEFACGGWMKRNTIPIDRSSIASYGVLRDEIQVKLRELLEGEQTENEIEAVTKAKHLYKSCMNISRIEKENVSVAVPLLEELGGWPILGSKPGGKWIENQFSLETLLILLNKYSNIPYIYPYVYTDSKNKSNEIIFLDNPGFVMPGRKYYLRARNSPVFKAYEELGVKIATEFGADRKTAEQDFRDILDLEIHLANISTPPEKRRDNEKLYNKFTAGNLMYNLTDSSEIGFTWLGYIKGIFAMEGVRINITEDEEIVVKDLPYMEKLIPILSKYPKRVIANYAVWRIVKNRAANLPERFRTYLGEYGKVLYGSSRIRARWRKCVSYCVNYMGLPLGRLFVDKYFNEEAKSGVNDMIDNVFAAFKKILSELEWMDGETRIVAEEKVDFMVRKIGYDDDILEDRTLNRRYENVTIDPDDYFQNVLGMLRRTAIDDFIRLKFRIYRMNWETAPSTVNAYYNPNQNRIMFPAGILQPPYYHQKFPRSLNYGGIGTLIGHEITHGFDDRGRQFDKNGELQEWWSDEIVSKFNKMKGCFEKQYSNFSSPEAGGTKINGKITLGENIADNGGVLQSYRAYRNFVEKKGEEEDALPGLNLTHNQLFFINFAQIRCSIMHKKDAINHILLGPHSPSRFRVIGTLQNLPEFSEAFHCPQNSYMNPTKRCRIW